MNYSIENLKKISQGISWAVQLNLGHAMCVPPTENQSPSLFHVASQAFFLSTTVSTSCKAMKFKASPWIARSLSLLPVGVALASSRLRNARFKQVAEIAHKNLGHVIFAVNVVATTALAMQLSPVVAGTTLGMLSVELLTRSHFLNPTIRKTIRVSNLVFSFCMVAVFGSTWQRITFISLIAVNILLTSRFYKSFCQKMKNYLFPIPQDLTSGKISTVKEIQSRVSGFLDSLRNDFGKNYYQFIDESFRYYTATTIE